MKNIKLMKKYEELEKINWEAELPVIVDVLNNIDKSAFADIVKKYKHDVEKINFDALDQILITAKRGESFIDFETVKMLDNLISDIIDRIDQICNLALGTLPIFLSLKVPAYRLVQNFFLFTEDDMIDATDSFIKALYEVEAQLQAIERKLA